jgi:hypothetical protein
VAHPSPARAGARTRPPHAARPPPSIDPP